MEVADAASLIEPAIQRSAPGSDDALVRWADLGAGRGTFTRALAGLLGPHGRVAAVDRDPRAVAALACLAGRDAESPGAWRSGAVPPPAVAPGGRPPDRVEHAAADRIARVSAHRADFANPDDLDAVLAVLGWRSLRGILLANALHFVPAAAQPAVVGALAERLSPGGRLVVVEYEGRRPSPWVPAPVSFARLRELATTLPGVSGPVWVGERPSAFGGAMYAAFLERRS